MKKYSVLLFWVGLCSFQSLPAVNSSSHAKFAYAWAGAGAVWVGYGIYSHYSDFVKKHPNKPFGEYISQLSNDACKNKGAIAKRAALIGTLAGLGHGIIHYHESNSVKEVGNSSTQNGMSPKQSSQECQPIFVNRKNLFKEIFGVSERAFKANYSLLPYEFDDKGFLFVTPSSGKFEGKKINCGKFTQLSLGELRFKTKDIKNSQPGVFKVIQGEVASLQADPAHRDAVFQAASNFNGLETVGADQNIEEQLLGSYIYDRTQGPAASLSAFGGTLLRRYFVYHNDHKENLPLWGQRVDAPLNFLDAIIEKVPVSKAGYVIFDKPPQVPSAEDYDKIKIGFHENVQVLAGVTSKDGQQQEVIQDQNQVISQVFTAAIDLAVTNSHFKDNGAVQAWAQEILNASYEGTLRAAALAGKKQVFLTLVGGGVFENSFESIGNAITRMKDFIVDSGLEVTVALYGAPKTQQESDLRARLQVLAAETKKDAKK